MGFEPITFGLQDRCSTNELFRIEAYKSGMQAVAFSPVFIFLQWCVWVAIESK